MVDNTPHPLLLTDWFASDLHFEEKEVEFLQQDSLVVSPKKTFAQLHSLVCRDYWKNNNVSKRSACNASFPPLILLKAIIQIFSCFWTAKKSVVFFFSIVNHNIIVFKIMVNLVVEVIKSIKMTTLMSVQKVLQCATTFLSQQTFFIGDRNVLLSLEDCTGTHVGPVSNKYFNNMQQVKLCWQLLQWITGLFLFLKITSGQ